ncbi:hypothetical protein HPB49_009814 [Dermacentor silvarum]|uniref:Uncharacterized protein n=1 Tax=Dermacentor silvarum TaxID=543639 RepID=A0ACB8DYF1_DERSI|nr:hypothetical protein HPB49_009814 [Dermacentor silvarum]
MRPFDVVRDEEFLKLADELVARYGTISAKELLPHPTTVSRKAAQGKLELSELHTTATFLWLPLRHLRALEEDERSTVYTSVKAKIATIPTNFLQTDGNTAETCSEEPTKRRFMDDFEEWHDVRKPEKRRDELDSYVHAAEVCEHIENLLQWWKPKFPRLSHLARQILWIPATSASSERNFSAAGYVMHQRRRG